jgi:hypothetical protein
VKACRKLGLGGKASVPVAARKVGAQAQVWGGPRDLPAEGASDRWNVFALLGGTQSGFWPSRIEPGMPGEDGGGDRRCLRVGSLGACGSQYGRTS